MEPAGKPDPATFSKPLWPLAEQKSLRLNKENQKEFTRYNRPEHRRERTLQKCCLEHRSRKIHIYVACLHARASVSVRSLFSRAYSPGLQWRAHTQTGGTRLLFSGIVR